MKSVDKKLQDHGKLYNEFFVKYEEVQVLNTKLCGALSTDDEETNLEKTFRRMRKRLGKICN